MLTMSHAAPDKSATVRAVVQHVGSDAPGCAVGVVQDGAVVFAEGFGLACLEHGAPITTATRFYLASVSKQVTALAVVLAAETGQLSLGDPIRKYLAELPACMDGVTLRHLLTHTGGVRDYFHLGFLAGFGGEHPYSEDEVLRILARQSALNFPPGTDFTYSNSGYVLLAIVIARATGKRLDAFARETIFAPLGMHASSFQHDHTVVVPNKAFGYELREGGWRTANCQLDVVGDGGMYASLDDMLAWTRNLLSPRIGVEAIDLLRSPVKLANGISTRYGMGLGVGAHRGLATLEHGGGMAGYRTHLLAYPSERLGVVVLCNDAAAIPAVVARQVAETFLADRMTPAPPTPPAPPPEAIVARAGCYRAPEGDVIALTECDGELFVQGLPRPLRALSANSFAIAGDPDLLRLEFEPDGPGLTVAMGGVPDRSFSRCETQSAIDAAAYVGGFESGDIAADPCRVTASDGTAAVSFANGSPLQLSPIGSDCLWIPEVGVTLSFERESDGGVGRFRLDSARVRGIVFTRTGQALLSA
jgi:CubicO group peptidase (beta-lactamase class C family)